MAGTRERRPLAERFWEKVDREGMACWPWKAATANGYGTFMLVKHHMVSAHRVAWELEHGSIPDGLYVCHRCDNKLCCNPAHLFLGTPTDNVRDMHAKGRDRNGERQRGEAHRSAKLTDASVREIRTLRHAGMGLGTLARRFGVSKHAVRMIVRRKPWVHVV